MRGNFHGLPKFLFHSNIHSYFNRETLYQWCIFMVILNWVPTKWMISLHTSNSFYPLPTSSWEPWSSDWYWSRMLICLWCNIFYITTSISFVPNIALNRLHFLFWGWCLVLCDFAVLWIIFLSYPANVKFCIFIENVFMFYGVVVSTKQKKSKSNSQCMCTDSNIINFKILHWKYFVVVPIIWLSECFIINSKKRYIILYKVFTSMFLHSLTLEFNCLSKFFCDAL